MQYYVTEYWHTALQWESNLFSLSYFCTVGISHQCGVKGMKKNNSRKDSTSISNKNEDIPRNMNYLAYSINRHFEIDEKITLLRFWCILDEWWTVQSVGDGNFNFTQLNNIKTIVLQ